MANARRTFRHDAAARSWWVETEGLVLRTTSASDDDPDGWRVRERRCASEAAATVEAERLSTEQLAGDFREHAVPSLGMFIHRDRHRAQTRNELDDLLRRARERV